MNCITLRLSITYSIGIKIFHTNNVKSKNGRCLICDDVSIGVNFGVLTCMPCKAFFRRNAVRLGVQKFVCQNDGHCLVTYKYRRSCNCCRLAKCFRVGMKKALILSDEEREARNKLVEVNRLKRGKAPKPLRDEWLRPPTLLRMPSNSFECLSPSDQVVLANIFHAYENTCIVARNKQFQFFPVVQHTSIHAFFNEVAILFPVFIEYFKHVPEFENIHMDDKLRLVKNHFGVMLNINEPLMHPVTSCNLIATWTNIYGVEIAARLLKRNQILEQFLYDPILLKLLLIVLVLSSSNARMLETIDMDQICDYPLAIYAAQNIYAELLWRYILSRSANEEDAVKFFDKLMICVLHMKNVHMHVYDYINHFKDEIKQMEPIMQSMWPLEDPEEDLLDFEIIEDIPL